MEVVYIVLGLLLLAYQGMQNSVKSRAEAVGGGGVLVALVFGFIALVIATRAQDRVEELEKKVEELETKVEESEWDDND